MQSNKKIKTNMESMKNNRKLLEDLKNIDVCTVKKEDLVDINSVIINRNLSKEERWIDYVRQIKNPYCFVCDGSIVKIEFNEEGDSLEDKLSDYFISL